MHSHCNVRYAILLIAVLFLCCVGSAAAETLEMPEITLNTSGLAGTDITGSVTIPEGATLVCVEINLVEGGQSTPIMWDMFYRNTSKNFTVLGAQVTEPGLYQLKAEALAHEIWEEPNPTIADSETLIREFTLTGEVPDCPEVIMSATEAEYDPEKAASATFTIEGAEAVTYQLLHNNYFTEEYSDEEVGGMGGPASVTDGDTRTVFFNDGPKTYYLICWGRFNGIWCKGKTVRFRLHPLDALEIPTVFWGGEEIKNAMTINSLDKIIFTASCENAVHIGCEVMQLLGNDNSEWLGWFDQDGAEVAFDLREELGLGEDGLPEGRYCVSFWPDGPEGWADHGAKKIILTVVSNSDIIAAGECSETVKWQLDKSDVLTIYGAGAIPDYDNSNAAPWDQYSFRKVVMLEGITHLGNRSFQLHTELTDVEIASSVKSIGSYAFYSCGLTGNLVIPDGVVSIEEGAFLTNEKLTSVTLPGSLTTIGYDAFSGCGLNTIKAADNTEVEKHIFYYADNDNPDHHYAVIVEIPKSVMNAHPSAFSYCRFPHAEPDFVPPGSLRTIDAEAFAGTAPTFVWLPDGTETIAEGAFSGCANLQYVRIPDDCHISGDDVFPGGTVILCTAGSPAAEYAETNGFTFVMLYTDWGNG